MAPQQPQGTYRVRALPIELRRPMFARERFGKDDKAVERVEETERGGDPERQARIDVAGEAADRRTDDEAEPKGGAEQTEGPGATLVRGDIGDVRRGRRHVRGRDA